jgi:hypothetical protein
MILKHHLNGPQFSNKNKNQLQAVNKKGGEIIE